MTGSDELTMARAARFSATADRLPQNSTSTGNTGSSFTSLAALTWFTPVAPEAIDRLAQLVYSPTVGPLPRQGRGGAGDDGQAPGREPRGAEVSVMPG